MPEGCHDDMDSSTSASCRMALLGTTDNGGRMKLILDPPAMTAVCPFCGSDVLQFLGNESCTGKSWYKCVAHPPTQQVFSLKLPEPPRFELEARS